MTNNYIDILANNSKTNSHEYIDECLMYYGVSGLKDLTEKQLEDFCKFKHLI